LKPLAVARGIANLTLTKKAKDVLLMDLRGLTSMADYFVVCSADSDIQVRAIADAVVEGMEKKGTRPWHIESGSANWILLDYVDVVLHVFHRNIRPFYNLERLWGDASVKRMVDNAEPVRKVVARTSKPRGAPHKSARRTRK
jgi:ribosome-associated protein